MLSHNFRHKSIRLAGYDYGAAGRSFITVVSHERAFTFGEVKDSQVVLSQEGEIVQEEWRRTAVMRQGVQIEVVVVMPNHFHAVLWFDGPTRLGSNKAERNAPLQTTHIPQALLGSLIAGFKAARRPFALTA